ncbi:MAG: peptidoglycan-binding protein [Alphaproteobacteria bacterium]|nr:peptidoglycan-binding protein [Alphaproteobacteria bacterium]
MGAWNVARAWLFALIVGLGSWVQGAPRADAAGPDDGAFRYFAQTILAGIGRAKFSDVPAIGGYGRPRVAVLPFSSEETEVPPTVASELNSLLLAELTRQGSKHYRFVAREALKAIIKEIDTIGELDPGNDGRVKDLLRNARVDILIVGRLRNEDAGYVLSYEAVSVEDGTLFAATGPRRVHGLDRFAAPRGAPLDAREAMRRVAWRFARALGREKIVTVAPLGKAPDGQATPVGDYLTELLADSLRDRLARPGRAPVRVAVAKDGTAAAKTGAARIKGRYWAVGGRLEVRLVLHRADGSAIPWRRLVSARGLPVMPAPNAAPAIAAAPRAPVQSAPLQPEEPAPPRPATRAPAMPPAMATGLPGPDPLYRPRVQEAQRLLAGLGYAPGPADGFLRTETRAALRAFQRDHGLAPHGRLTRSVMRWLRRSFRRVEIAL